MALTYADHQPATALARLRRQWLALALFYSALVVLAYLLLSEQWQPPYAARWAMLAGLALAAQLAMLWRRLPENHRPGETALLPTLGLANLLSLLRGLLLGLLAGFLFLPWPPGWLAWAPGILYTAAIVIDLLDGLAARLTNRATRLGAGLDTELDALGILIAPLLGVWYGQLPVWYLLASASRYLFVFGQWTRQRQGKPVYHLPPSATRRPLAGLQMGLISAVLWPILEPPATTIAATLIMAPFLVGFIRDWLVVSGRIDPDSAGYEKAHRQTATLLAHWLPPALRFALVALVTGLALGIWPGATALALFGPLELALLALVALGVAGRLAAALLLIRVEIGLAQIGFAPGSGPLVAVLCLLMLLGSGAFSIWQPEERILTHRLGDRD